MRQNIMMILHMFFFAAVVVFQCAQGAAQSPPALDEQLKAQYKLVKTGSDAGGLTIVEPGTVLAVQKGGILGVKPGSMAICPSKFQDGDLHGPSGFCTGMVKGGSRYFQKGEKVYPTKIEVNVDKDRVAVFLVDCDTCNGTNPPTFYKAEVVFQFSKGELKTKSVPQVEDTIAQVLAIDQEGPTEQAQGSPNPSQAAEQPPPQPQSIGLGQTNDQVVAALGQPEKIVNLGAKQIYVYKDLKVTFVNGKVSDVQ